MPITLLDELTARMNPDNQEHAAAPYAERMTGVEDCLDVLDMFFDDDPAVIVKVWWQALSAWFEAIDCFDSDVCGVDPAAEAFLQYETGRMMAKRRDVLEAVSKHYAAGHYTDPEHMLGTRGTTAICLSNSMVDYGDAAARANRVLRDLKRQAKVTA